MGFCWNTDNRVLTFGAPPKLNHMPPTGPHSIVRSQFAVLLGELLPALWHFKKEVFTFFWFSHRKSSAWRSAERIPQLPSNTNSLKSHKTDQQHFLEQRFGHSYPTIPVSLTSLRYRQRYKHTQLYLPKPANKIVKRFKWHNQSLKPQVCRISLRRKERGTMVLGYCVWEYEVMLSRVSRNEKYLVRLTTKLRIMEEEKKPTQVIW